MRKKSVHLLFCLMFFSLGSFGQERTNSYSLTDLGISGRVLHFNALGNEMHFLSGNGEIKLYNFDSKEELLISNNIPLKRKSLSNIEVSSSSDLTNIVLIDENGQKKRITPFGNKNYLNVSLSPNENRLLFRVSGMGSYISDLEGNIISKFPDAEFPIWINENEILYAVIDDDGHQFISSDLYTHHLESGKRKNITEEIDEICLFPVLNKDKSLIAFTNPNEKIFLFRNEN